MHRQRHCEYQRSSIMLKKRQSGFFEDGKKEKRQLSDRKEVNGREYKTGPKFPEQHNLINIQVR